MLVLRSTRHLDFISKLHIEKSKLRVIGHNPNSTKFQLAIVNCKLLNRFFSRHTTNFAAGSAGPRDLELVAHLMGFLLWPTEWSSFDEELHEFQVLLSVFFQVFFVFLFCFSFTLSFYFCCKHYVTVRNTNYYLCFSQFENRVCVCFCVSVQLIEEKYCCDCFVSCFFVSL